MPDGSYGQGHFRADFSDRDRMGFQNGLKYPQTRVGGCHLTYVSSPDGEDTGCQQEADALNHLRTELYHSLMRQSVNFSCPTIRRSQLWFALPIRGVHQIPPLS